LQQKFIYIILKIIIVKNKGLFLLMFLLSIILFSPVIIFAQGGGCPISPHVLHHWVEASSLCYFLV
jgi:hypothetical protein